MVEADQNSEAAAIRGWTACTTLKKSTDLSMPEPDFELPHDVLLGGDLSRRLGLHGGCLGQVTAPDPLCNAVPCSGVVATQEGIHRASVRCYASHELDSLAVGELGSGSEEDENIRPGQKTFEVPYRINGILDGGLPANGIKLARTGAVSLAEIYRACM